MMRLLLCLLLSSVVNSQTEFPFVSFRGETLPNHGYVDLSLVGVAEDGGDSVQCHTDLTSCCTGGITGAIPSANRPDWYFPDRTEMGYSSGGGDIYQRRGAQRIDLRRRNNALDLSPSGIYRCEIPTDDGDLVRETVYVGIYDSGGTLHIEVDITFTVDSDLNGASPQFTLTCISTGGPATTVTWTRDSVTVTEGNETVLDDPVTAQYTHTLTVTGTLGGLYTCTVANNKPSSDSASFFLQVLGQLYVSVGTRTATSISLSWSVPSDSVMTRYEVTWQRVGCPDDEDEGSITLGSRSNYNMRGLEEDSRYIITVTAFNSNRISAVSNTVTTTTLEAAPSAAPISVRVSEVTSSSITVQLESVPCIHQNGDITGHLVKYTGGGSTETIEDSNGRIIVISDLEPSTRYSIQVAAVNSAGTGPYSNVVDQLTEVVPPDLSSGSTTATFISLSWTSGGSEGVSYEVMWQRDTSLECPDDEDEGRGTISSTSYDIMGLEEDSRYSITVTASNAECSSEVSNTVTAMTEEAASSAAPDSVSISEVTSSNITVQWEFVPCIHRNGDITGYSVQYTGGGSTQTMSVSGGDVAEATITGLTASTSYSVRVAAVNDAGTGPLSSSQFTVTLVVPPVLSAGTTTATSISLSWTSGGSEGVSYEVIWQRDTSLECHDEDEGRVTISSTSYDITGQEEDSRYSITVTASNVECSSEVSNTVTLMTEEAAPSASPDFVSIIEVTSSSITVQWEMVPCIHRNGDITGYSVRYTGGGRTQTMPAPGDSWSSERMHVFSNLKPSTHYSIQVAAVNSAGTGFYSRRVTRMTEVKRPVLTAGITTSTLISLSWTNSGSEGVSYEVTWQIDTSLECPDVDEGRDTISSTSYIIMGLEEGISYFIRVRASNEASSAVSESVTAMTLEAAPSGPPTAVRTSGMSTTITVHWEPVECIHRNGDITSYSLQYGRESAEGERIVEMVSGDEVTITGLIPSTVYSIEMAAVNSAGTGVYSDVMYVPTESVYLSLNGDIIPNHGYVVISDIGSTDNTAFICHTNRPAFHNDAGYYHSEGDWIAPDETIVYYRRGPGFVRNRDPTVVRLLRSTAHNPPAEGIYQCRIQDVTETSQTLYVGLYNSGRGNLIISDTVMLTVDSDLSGVSPQFTLTCISTGGPATTITWTKDSVTVTEGTETVLDDPVTAQYTHTLTVTGRLGGLYTCTVTNNKPSSDSASYFVQSTEPPSDVLAIQTSGTSILVSWRPSGDATGYIISYTGAGRSGSVTVSGGNYTLTGLLYGATYTISIVATSQYLRSDAIVSKLTLVSVPSRPSVSVGTITATSISLSWSVPSDSVVTSYEVMWRETDSGDTEMTSDSLTNTSYTIEQLEINANYTITVSATNIAGSTESLPIIFLTGSNLNPDSTCSVTDHMTAIIGGVAVFLSLTMAVTVIVAIVIACRRATAAQKSDMVDAPISGTTDEALDQSKPSEKEEEKYVDSDVIPTSTNEAYHTVGHPRETVAAYAIVNIPRTVPSHS